MSTIRIQNLSKRFEDNHLVLDKINLNIEKGDVYGILGLSGAGKSTLVRCINGLETFDEGEIYFNDELLCSSTKKIDNSYRRRIGMIFQNFNLLQQKNVLQNVALGLRFAHDAAMIQKAKEAIIRVGLQDKMYAYPSQLSGGQQQRVAIARTLALNPEVILSDEATSALDPDTTNSILDLLSELNKDYGITIVMISHQMNAIERICNKVAIISDGTIVEDGPLQEVFLNPKADVAKQLIYSSHIHTQMSDEQSIRILFDGNLDEPIIANIVKDCDVLVSILYADTKIVKGKVYGQVLIKDPESSIESDKVKQYLTAKNVKFEEVKHA